MLHRLRQWLCPDLAIDLGTANTLVAIQGEGDELEGGAKGKAPLTSAEHDREEL